MILNGGSLPICLPTCDPLVQDCVGSNVCVWNPTEGDSFVCILDASGGMAPAGTPCMFNTRV